MPTDPLSLPDDFATLKAMIAARDVALAAERLRVKTLEGQLSDRAIEIEHLKLLIAKLKRQQYGRKSEKLDRQS